MKRSTPASPPRAAYPKRSAIRGCSPKDRRSSARRVTKCMWQRTRHRNSSQRSNSAYSSGVNNPAPTSSIWSRTR